MKISVFDKRCSPEDYEEDYFDGNLIIAGMLLTDGVTLISDDPRINFMFIEVSQLSDEDVIDWFKGVFKYGENARTIIDYYDSIMPYVKKLLHTKKKDKAMMAQFINFKKDISNFRNNLNKYREIILNDLYLKEVLPFYKEGSLVSYPLKDIIDPNKEDVFIKPLVDTLIRPDEIISLTDLIEDNYYHEMGDLKEDDCDYIKIPLCSFPYIKEMNYSQLKFTRDDLAPVLMPFNKCLKELSVEFLEIPFTVENLPRIKELCEEKLMPQIEAVQQKINESLYLCQQKNKNPENTGLEISLGISSVQFILESLEYIEVVLPYVGSEIKQQISRHMAPESTRVFIYVHDKDTE